jgi:virginiamycin A acetyltransferase
MKIKINKTSKQKILNLGFEIQEGNYHVSNGVKIEIPTNLMANLSSDIKIGAFSYGGNNLISNLEIGRYCNISADVRIFSRKNHPTNWLSTSPFQYNDCFNWWKFFKKSPHLIANQEAEIKKTIIGNDVWIGNNVFIESGVKIGDGAIIGMDARVSRDVPPYAIIINRNEIKGYRFSDEIIKKLLEIKWWNYNFTEFGEISWNNIERAITQISERIKHLEPYKPKILTQKEFTEFSNSSRWFL